MLFFTSDLHFCHNREFLYKPRGFSSIEEHDRTIVERWNSVVKPEDTVYILGDLMLNDNEQGMKYLNQLNGTKYFVRGNHDTDNRIKFYEAEGKNLHYLGAAEFFRYEKYHFFLSHFPALTGNLENEKLSQMTLNLYGHTHQKTNFFEDRPYMYHVGLDSHDCYPVPVTQIVADMRAKVEECKQML